MKIAISSHSYDFRKEGNSLHIESSYPRMTSLGTSTTVSSFNLDLSLGSDGSNWLQQIAKNRRIKITLEVSDD